MAKQLKLAADQYTVNREEAAKKFDFVTTVIGNLHEIKQEDAVSMVESSIQLLDKWKQDMDKKFDFSAFFLSLYRRDGTSKVTDPLLLSRFAEMMGEYHLTRAESFQQANEQNIILQPIDDYLLAMHFTTFAIDRREYLLQHPTASGSMEHANDTDATQQHTAIIDKLHKRQKQIQILFYLKYFSILFDPRENQIVTDVKHLRKCIQELERMGDLLSIEFPSRSRFCYELIIRISSHPKVKLSDQEKHEITTRIVDKHTIISGGGDNGEESLGIENIHLNVEAEDYALDKKRLRTLRDELKSMDVDTSSATIFGTWSEGMYDLLYTLISNVVTMIGPAPNGVEFCSMVFGSLARREACPFSDIEMCFIYKSPSVMMSENAVNYLKILSRLLDLSVIAMGETVSPLNANQGGSALQMISGGFQFDGNFNPSRNGDTMILSLDSLIAEMPSFDLIQSNLFFAANFAYGSKSLFEDFKERAVSSVFTTSESDSVQLQEQFVNFLRDGIMDFVSLQKEYVLTDESSNEIDPQYRPRKMKDHIKLLTTILSQLCFRYQIYEPSNTARVDKLHGANPTKLHSALRTVLIDLIIWMTNVRCKIHLYYGSEIEEFLLMSLDDATTSTSQTNSDSKDKAMYVFDYYDRMCFRRYSSHIQPMLIRLAQVAYGDEASLESANKSTFAELCEEDLRCIAEYWVLRSEDEITIYRKQHQHRSPGERIEYSGIDDIHLLRANAYFEYASLASDSGSQEAFQQHTINKFVKVDAKTGVSSIQPVYSDEYLKTDMETYGRSKVRQLAGEVHIKEYPELPGVEYLASELAHQLTGYTCSYSILHKFDRPPNQPVMLSKTVIGTNLQDVLLQNPNFLEEELDNESFSFHFIRTLILSPEDDKPDNFIVQHSGGISGIHDKKKKLVCVDNDHSFAVPIIRGNIYNELVVKSIIYCSGKMHLMIHPSVVEVIKRWNPEQIIQQWMDSAIKQDQHYCSLFPKEAWLQTNPSANSDQTKCAIPLTVEKNLAVSIFIKMKILQTLLSASSDLTHLQILEKLEPDLEKQYYGRVLRDSKLTTTEQRFTVLTKSLYKVIDSRRRSQTNTNRMLQSSLGKIPTEKEIKERKNSTPKQMKEVFEANFPSGWIERAKVIQQEIVSSGNDKSYWELSNDTLREEVISGIWFSSYGRSLITGIDFTTLDENAMNHVLTVLEKRPNEFINLSLKKCSILTDDRLLRILRRSPELVNLDIRGCMRLTPAVLPEIERMYENKNLRQVLNNLEDIARGMDAIEVTYRLVTGDETVTDAELLHCIQDETLEDDFKNQVMRFTALRLFESRITDKAKIVEILEAAGKHAFGGDASTAATTDRANANGVVRVNDTVLLIFLGAVKSVEIEPLLLREYARIALAAKDYFWSSTAMNGMTASSIGADDFLAEKQIVRMSLMLILCVNGELENSLKESLASAFTAVCDETFINSPEAIHSILALICHSTRPLPMAFVTHCVDYWMRRIDTTASPTAASGNQSSAQDTSASGASSSLSSEISQKIVTFCVHILLFYPQLTDDTFLRLLQLTGRQSFSFEHFHALTSIREASFDDIERFVLRAMALKEEMMEKDNQGQESSIQQVVLAIGLIFAMALMMFNRQQLIGPMCQQVAYAFMLSVKKSNGNATGANSNSLLSIILSIWLKKILTAKSDVIDADSWMSIANYLLLAPPPTATQQIIDTTKKSPSKGKAENVSNGVEDDILFAIGLRAGIEFDIIPQGGELMYLERLERLAGRILQRGGDCEEDCIEILQAVWTMIVNRGGCSLGVTPSSFTESQKEMWSLINRTLSHCLGCFQGKDTQPILAMQFLHIVLAIQHVYLTNGCEEGQEILQHPPFPLESFLLAGMEKKEGSSASIQVTVTVVLSAIMHLFMNETTKVNKKTNTWERQLQFVDYVVRRMKWSPVLTSEVQTLIQERLIDNVINYSESDWQSQEIDYVGHRNAINLAIVAHKLDATALSKLLQDAKDVISTSMEPGASSSTTTEGIDNVSAQNTRRTLCLSTIVAIIRSFDENHPTLTDAEAQSLVKFLLRCLEHESSDHARHHNLISICLMVEKGLITGDDTDENSNALVKEVLQILLETRVTGKYLFADMTEIQRDEILSLHQESVIKILQDKLNQLSGRNM